MYHRGDGHKIEFRRAAVVACDWTSQPLPRETSHQLTFQQIYGELESPLQLSKEGKLEQMCDKPIIPLAQQKISSQI